MNQFSVAFAGSTLTIHHDTEEALSFLTLLFKDVTSQISRGNHHRLSLLHDRNQKEYQLYDADTLICRGRLGVKLAAQLYDTVIFHLLNRAGDGVALHAGGVIWNDRVVLFPGQSGSGKSTLTFWLTSRGCSYLTDELIFIPAYTDHKIEYFSRPLCLKPGSTHLLDTLPATELSREFLWDTHGAVIPHRLLKTNFIPTPAAPSLIILPNYCPDSETTCETVSRARLATQLMGCHVNARNLANHGFSQVLDIARATPAYQLSFSDLEEAEYLLNKLLPE